MSDPTPPPSWTIHALAEQVGLTVRSVRHYSSRGLLPRVQLRGARTVYGPEHLGRLRAVRRLRARGLDIDEIRSAIERMASEELAALEAAETATPPPAPPPPASPVEAPAAALAGSRWERIPLLPGLELHMRVDAGALVLRLAEEMVARYRAVERA